MCATDRPPAVRCWAEPVRARDRLRCGVGGVAAFDRAGRDVTAGSRAGALVVADLLLDPALQARKADRQVTFVGVNTQDTPHSAEALAGETGVTYHLVRDPDGALFEAFGGIGMPATFYVDPDGDIVGRHTGLLTREAVLDDLREHLGVDAGPSP
jgi:hypothetical protein